MEEFLRCTIHILFFFKFRLMLLIRHFLEIQHTGGLAVNLLIKEF
jgi:hypothetical protein